MNIEQAVKQLEALGNSTRLQLYRTLVMAGHAGIDRYHLCPEEPLRLGGALPPAPRERELGKKDAAMAAAHALPEDLEWEEILRPRAN